ncbi:MAG: hypothetical protein Q7T79_01800 [bacterium]|nr:hypothetical protein [bacterium]
MKEQLITTPQQPKRRTLLELESIISDRDNYIEKHSEEKYAAAFNELVRRKSTKERNGKEYVANLLKNREMYSE